MSFIPTSAYEPGFPLEWEGLDIVSADEATPKWYGVSSGDGNDGVSHLWPDYYVRTCDPYRLAELALVALMNVDYYSWAIENVEVDGDAEYTISATLYNPPDDGEYEVDFNWCDVNGAWTIVEVFPIEDMDSERSRAPRYDSLADAFPPDLLMRVTSE